MALRIGCVFSHTLILVGLLSLFQVIPSSGFNLRKLVNASSDSSPDGLNWGPAIATWYGPPNGDGSEGGACGYGNAVGIPPFSSLISAGNPRVFDSGKGCGSCYEVKCTGNSACSGNPVRVVITDLCPECGTDAQYHFDLSGHAFGSMALQGRDGALRTAGKINIQFRRVGCNYPGTTIAFQVDTVSNAYWFSLLIEYVNGDGGLNKVELKEGSSSTWQEMQPPFNVVGNLNKVAPLRGPSGGAYWNLAKGTPLRAPFSFRLTTLETGKTLVANNVIPVGWKPGVTYRSVVNFPPT